MNVHDTFTYGLPGETPAQRLETARYRDSLRLDTYQQSGTAELEGMPRFSSHRVTGVAPCLALLFRVQQAGEDLSPIG